MVSKEIDVRIRNARQHDRYDIANLMHMSRYTHRHLDWRPPLDWIGLEPYLVAEEGERVTAVLACPPDPPSVAWIRLFTAENWRRTEYCWEQLWPVARAQLIELDGDIYIAAIPLHKWFQNLLQASDFEHRNQVIIMAWEGEKIPPPRQVDFSLRPMVLDDIDSVKTIDLEAFGGVWQNSRSCLEIAFRQSALATVAEFEGEILGYQISTATQMGAHLARLAVRPAHQGMGLGYALVQDTIGQFSRKGVRYISVNTQEDNLVSLALYKKAGFRATGEDYPLYQFQIR